MKKFLYEKKINNVKNFIFNLLYMNKPTPKDLKLYNKIKTYYTKKYKPSAYRSGLIVRDYKNEYFKKYNDKNAYYGIYQPLSGLSRWFLEEWTNERGNIGYEKPDDIYRPNIRITDKTPLTFKELTPQRIKKAKLEKKNIGRVSRF